MKVVRKKTKKQVKTSRRPARRYINPADQISYCEQMDNTINNPQTFTWMDYNRNQNMIRSFT